MNYYLDTEFIEGFKKPIKWLPTIGNFNKPYHSIQLISIGIVCEDGREYYAVSNEFNPNDANDWVKENVLCSIATVPEIIRRQTHIDKLVRMKINGAKNNKQIANEIIKFILDPNGKGLDSWLGSSDDYFRCLKEGGTDIKPQFYAYYADYDWVVFCSLFGTMIDLPKGFPMYCIDLKQEMDSVVLAKKGMGSLADDFETKLAMVKCFTSYPKQTNEHNALADAKWNYELHKFIQTL